MNYKKLPAIRNMRKEWQHAVSLTKSEKRPVSDRVGLQRGESKDTNTVRKLFGKGWNPQYHIIDGWNTESNILGKHFLSEKNQQWRGTKICYFYIKLMTFIEISRKRETV